MQKQRDSDTLAHFIDIVGLIQRSSWRSYAGTIGLSNPKTTDLSSHESLVFVSVYYRQLFCDNLLGQVKNTYCRLASSSGSIDEVKAECKAAKERWNSAPHALRIASQLPASAGIPKLDHYPTLAELFDSFLYGAHVLHSRGPKSGKNAERLRELLGLFHPHTLLGFLHGGFKDVYGPVSSIGARIYREFNELKSQHSLPAPEVYWQNQLFNTQQLSGAEK